MVDVSSSRSSTVRQEAVVGSVVSVPRSVRLTSRTLPVRGYGAFRSRSTCFKLNICVCGSWA
jgi:hypothetical protein